MAAALKNLPVENIEQEVMMVAAKALELVSL